MTQINGGDNTVHQFNYMNRSSKFIVTYCTMENKSILKESLGSNPLNKIIWESFFPLYFFFKLHNYLFFFFHKIKFKFENNMMNHKKWNKFCLVLMLHLFVCVWRKWNRLITFDLFDSPFLDLWVSVFLLRRGRVLTNSVWKSVEINTLQFHQINYCNSTR
jgi:hypothetical protein